MSRDIKWALREAEEQGAISKITIEDDRKKKLMADIQKGNVKMFLASLVVLAVAIAIVVAIVLFAHIVFYSVKMVILYILLIIFPFYSIYNLVSTGSAIKKGDYDFYTGEIVMKTDSGYKVKGLEDQNLSFVKKPDAELAAGTRVNIVRVKDEVQIFGV